MSDRTKRVTITLPEDLIAEIKAASSNLSGYLAEAAAERLRRDAYRRAVSASAGAWPEVDHPDLTDVESITKHVTALRAGWNRAT